jgi:hypothetical protein
MYRTLMLLTALALGGCATGFKPAADPTGGSALIYFYRADEIEYLPSAGAVHIYVDGKNVLDLDQATYSHAYVASGSHDLAMAFAGDDRPDQTVHLAIMAVPGQTLYIGCGTFIAALGGIDMTLDNALRVTDSYYARGHIAQYHERKMPN